MSIPLHGASVMLRSLDMALLIAYAPGVNEYVFSNVKSLIYDTPNLKTYMFIF